MSKLREAVIELLKSAPDHIDGHWPELDEVVKALAQHEPTPANSLAHEINLVMTDPESNLSDGAQRALLYVSHQLNAIKQPEQDKRPDVGSAEFTRVIEAAHGIKET